MGLLDQLFGAGGDDPRSQANMALAAGLLSGNLAGGLLGANQVFAEAPDRKLRRGLLEAQLAETQAQADERKSKLALAQKAQADQTSFLYGSGGMSPGAFAPSADGFGPTMPQGAAPMGGGVIAQARAMGIPEDAIKADVLFNGGKKISELLAKHGSRDMQVSNGYAYDKNKLGAGFLPQLNVSQNGQTSMVQIDPNTGLPVVSAPSGALNTYAGYRNIDESAKANFDPVTVTPQGQPPQMTSRGALMRIPQVQGGVPAGADAGRADILNQEVTKAQAQLQAALRTGDQTAAQRANNDLTALNRELKAIGGTSRATVGMPLQSEAEKTQAIDDAKAAAARDATMQKGAMNSRDTLNYIAEARKLFDKGPTNSGAGWLVDQGANLFGLSTPGADAAAQLETLSGWMVSNVPRMEGPQSNFDVQNYKTMAGMVGDSTKPLPQRKAALDTLEKLQAKYAHLNQPGNDAEPPKPKAFPTMPMPSAANAGKTLVDTQTGKRYKSNGAKWVEIQ
jgi:hypothetical protein